MVGEGGRGIVKADLPDIIVMADLPIPYDSSSRYDLHKHAV